MCIKPRMDLPWPGMKHLNFQCKSFAYNTHLIRDGKKLVKENKPLVVTVQVWQKKWKEYFEKNKVI